MKKEHKRMAGVRKLFERNKQYPLKEAVTLLKKAHTVKFDETVEIAMHLGIDPKQSDQLVRGSIVLPHGLGKKIRVAVFCKGEEAAAAREAGAEDVGGLELIEKVKNGWLDFDVAVATPDMMRELAKIGKILGPRGLMPNPKTGTVTNDVGKAVREAKAGKVEFKTDKLAGVHVGVGKLSFSEDALLGNIQTVIDAVNKARPQTAKGHFIKTVSVSSTMGPGIKLDAAEYRVVA
ncbi:MAG: 50S ribosomal protein L1 [Candidatus Omnitrophica bacterium]|nr:50S ribosomal protein L1 [Candidatus Omnitrophota bacterium]